jgi:hypothetical protein
MPHAWELLLERLVGPWNRSHKPMRKGHCPAACDLPSHKQCNALRSRRRQCVQWHQLDDSSGYLCPQNWRLQQIK